MPEDVLVICAHPDDEIFGPGGTIAKYTQDGIRSRAVIFTYGLQSHPWEKDELTKEKRMRESKRAAGMVGYREVIFLGLDEGKILQQVEESTAIQRITNLINRYKPQKIFTHSVNDPHPDHRAVHRIVRSVVENLSRPPELYSFEIWTLLSLKERDTPKLHVDVSETFQTKLRALKCFKSQKGSLLSLIWSVYLKGFVYGLKNHCRYAEVFNKIPLRSKQQIQDDLRREEERQELMAEPAEVSDHG